MPDLQLILPACCTYGPLHSFKAIAAVYPGLLYCIGLRKILLSMPIRIDYSYGFCFLLYMYVRKVWFALCYLKYLFLFIVLIII